MHPYLDLLDQVVRIFGYPAILGAIWWAVRKFDVVHEKFEKISANAEIAVAGVAEVKAKVDVIQSNHLSHLQTGIEALAISNDKAVEVLQGIAQNIAVLVDRGQRA